MDKYVLSFLALRPYGCTVNPPWWAFWKKPRRFSKYRFERYSIILTAEEGTYLLERQPATYGTYKPEWTILFKALAGVGPGNVKDLQVEEIPGSSNYSPSEYVSTTT